MDNIIMRNILAIFQDESGATSIEYALIAFFVSIAGILALKQIGQTVNNQFNQVATNFPSSR